MTVSISPKRWDHLQVVPLTPWWPKLKLKIWPHLAESKESQIMDKFWCSRCLNDRINLPDMIGSFASGAIAFIVAKNWTKTLSQLFKELQGPNSELILSISKVEILIQSTISKFSKTKNQTKTLSQLFKELQGYLEAKIDYWYFIIFLRNGSKIPHKKFQVILSKHEGVTLIFPIQNEIKIWENCRHAFIFWRNDLRFFVWNLRTITQKKL